jgi:DNA-binding CsgD family transcriptional regulator
MEDLASLLEASGERAEAIGMHQSAYEIFGRVGAKRDAARVRGELRRLGIIRPQPADQVQRGWGSLSPAELAVVQVVAEGMTSKAAAEHLYLSVNTVNTHLRHAFAKLGVRSRVELTGSCSLTSRRPRKSQTPPRSAVGARPSVWPARCELLRAAVRCELLRAAVRGGTRSVGGCFPARADEVWTR